ncbi:LCP family protein [Streptomyces sp. NPDC059176]|uniref:LCP family glycopolymer transferase n=1 Tax=unclassified Streptomyces TaxID=2593676 RepID=UPI0036BAD615
MDAHVTDSAGTPAEPDDPAGTAGASGSGDGRHSGGEDGRGSGGRDSGGAGQRTRHRLRWIALCLSFFVLVLAGAGWWLYRKLEGNITTDVSAAEELARYDKERPLPAPRGAQNLLLIGSDTRAGPGNRKYGRSKGQRSDTTLLVHLAADRRSATVVSIPRDLMVDVPGCRTGKGTYTREQFTQFNFAFAFGGAACTIRTVERLTGVRIDHHMVIDFHGFKDMVDAVDGVTVCLTEPINDKDAHISLKAGRHTLSGEQALGYVRTRKSLGNGSDTERMGRQQQFLGALFNKVQSNGVLLNPTKLYPVLDAATKSLTTDPGLDSLRDLYDLTRSVRSIPAERVQFLTLPRRPYALDANRDELVEPDASRLFERLREDAPVKVVPSDTTASTDPRTHGDGSTGTGRRSPAPTFTGTNAATGTCR